MYRALTARSLGCAAPTTRQALRAPNREAIAIAAPLRQFPFTRLANATPAHRWRDGLHGG